MGRDLFTTPRLKGGYDQENYIHASKKTFLSWVAACALLIAFLVYGLATPIKVLLRFGQQRLTNHF